MAFNKAVGQGDLEYSDRQSRFDNVVEWEKTAGQRGLYLGTLARSEGVELMAAQEYLAHQPRWLDAMPGRQLITNPDFDYGKLGWVEYDSRWSTVREVSSDPYSNAVELTRVGDGHSSLSQMLYLLPGKCYQFSVVGSIERYDSTPNIWFYWETYDKDDRPTGHNVTSDLGDVSWGRFFGVFCLPPGKQEEQKVVVAAINVYGDATVTLGSVRLYELQLWNP